MLSQTKLKTLLAASALALMAGGAGAATFTLDFGPDSTSSNSPATGASGSVEFSFSDVLGDVLVTLDISNTTGSIPSFGLGATSSTLTGFGFDLLAGYVYRVGSFVGGTFLDTLILGADADPFGDFDLAAADNDNYNGGNANGGMPEGGTDTVSFRLDTTSTAAQAYADFLAGFFENGLDAGLRFQQVTGGDIDEEASDKLLFNPPAEIPVPAAGWLMIGALGGLAALRRRRQAV
jgi:hypothetical protein